MVRSLLFALAAASVTTAHFTLNWPPTAGFDEDNEPNAPCGGVPVTVDESSPEVQVDRFAVAIFSSHPAGTWSFLATTNTEEPYDFQQFAAVNSTGPGDFCLTEFSLPDDYAGKSGVIQVIDSSVDGTLYQCAPVRFVTGSNSTQGASCSNNTGFSAEFVSGGSSDASATPSSSGTEPSGTPSPSSAGAETPSSTGGAAAMATGMGSILGLGLLAAGLAL